MVKCFFAFGPSDTYLFYGPTQYCGNDLPGAVERILKQDNLKSVHHVAFGDPGTYFIGYELDGKNGAATHRIDFAGVPYALSQWIGSPAFPNRDIPSLRIALGPRNSALAWDKNGVYRSKLPKALDELLNTTSSPLYASLGYEDSFFIETTAGNVSWSFPDPSLAQCKVLDDFKTTGELALLAYASVSLFDPDHCIIILKDNRCLACLPDDWKVSCNDVAQGFINAVQSESESSKEKPTWETSGSKTVVFNEAYSPSNPYISEITFTFGPGDSYLYHSASRWCSRKLPPLIKNRMDNGMPLVNINQIALAPDGGFFYTYSKAGEAANAFDQHCLPPKLETYLHENWLDPASLRVVLGPWPSFFVMDKKQYYYDSLPQGLAADLDGLPNPAADPPEIMALGPGGSYFYRSKSGIYSYNLLGSNPELDGVFDDICHTQDSPAGMPTAFDDLMYMSLSPYTRGRFIGVFNDGRIIGNVPPEWREAVDSVTATIQEHFQQKQHEIEAQQRMQQAQQKTQQQKSHAAAATVARVSLPATHSRTMKGVAVRPPTVTPARRPVAKQHGSNFGSLLKAGVQILNAVNKMENMGSGGGNYVADTSSTIDPSSMDMSSFWQPLSNVASDPIQ